MTSALNRLADGTIELTINVPWEEVKKVQEDVLSELSKHTTVPGFRKGKAPKKLIEEKLDEEKVREEVIKKLLPKAVTEAISEHNLRPILTPQVAIREAADEKDWQFVAQTCEAPVVNLNNYKEAVGGVTAKSKIIVPGKEPEKPKLDDIIQALSASVKVTLPQILLDHEVNHLLSQTLDEIKKLGLTLEQYLSSTGKTAESLREEQRIRATNDLILELTLQKIAETEKITVDQKEIDEAIQKAKTDEERKNLEANRYLLARILRQQKTLDFLMKL